MEKFRLLIGIATIALLAGFGCSSINMIVPATRFDSPETRGQLLKGHIDPVVLNGCDKVVTGGEFGTVPPQTDFPAADANVTNFGAGGGVGILRDLDLEVKVLLSAPNQIGPKYQILGEPQMEARQGNLSLAAMALAGFSRDTGTKLDSTTQLRTSFRSSSYSADLAVIAGYRLQDKLLIFGGPYLARYWISGQIVQPAGTSNEFAFGGRIEQMGWSVGLDYRFGPFVLKFDEAWTWVSYKTVKVGGFHSGGMIGLFF